MGYDVGINLLIERSEFGYGPGLLLPAQIRATRDANKSTAERRVKTHTQISNPHQQ
jgi:hypothetical protein